MHRLQFDLLYSETSAPMNVEDSPLETFEIFSHAFDDETLDLHSVLSDIYVKKKKKKKTETLETEIQKSVIFTHYI